MTNPTVSTGSDTSGSTTELTVTGMSCTSCAARVESALNDQPGVTATADHAASSASVSRGPDAPDVDELITVIEGLGYGASPA